jgi:hypothetical protein
MNRRNKLHINKPSTKQLTELIENDGIVSFDPICVRNKSNLSKNKNEYKFDDNNYDSSKLLNDLPIVSPKLQKLLTKIKELDDADYKKHGKLFKHVIYSEQKNVIYGARLIASTLIANNMKIGYSAKLKPSYNPDNNENPQKQQKRYEKINMLSDEELIKTKNQNFYLLSSVSVYDQPITPSHKKEMLSRFNNRTDNTQGELIRIMVLDSGFKEGIDLFDIKYMHMFEPTINESMKTQIIGRGTRVCGQKGLDFHPIYGWQLHVFIYDLIIPKLLQSSFMGVDSTNELYLKTMNIDISQHEFANLFEKLTKFGAVDFELNKNINLIKNDLSITNPNNKELNNQKSFWEMRKYINDYFSEFSWEPTKLENSCKNKPNQISGEIIKYNPTQNFVRSYFTPTNQCKGILLWHSVGTGKTCSAIATATTQFEKQDYTILWVTRASLKNDIWKNMFNQVCNESIRNNIEYNNLEIPEKHSKRMRLLSKSWKIRPMSYKQFSNLVSQKNAYYDALVQKNGIDDPLRKTLIIIDEAHKLYNNDDLSVLEKPNMDAFYESIVKSYEISGKDSVRLMLMTATPIIDSPFDIIKLINLCKPINERIPDNYEQFTSKFLSNQGKFTENGKQEYLNNISGYISYLNRSKDASQFAQPIITNIDVPIIDDEQDVNKFDKKIVKEIQNSTIVDLRDKIIENNKLLELETADLDKNRFNFLKKEVCNEFTNIPKKICDKTVNSNIKLLVNDLKTNTKVIRDNIKETRSSLKEHIQTQKEHIGLIGKNKEEYKEDYSTYKNTPLYQLKQECSIKLDNNYKLQEKIKTHPPILEIDNKIIEYNEQLNEINSLRQLEINNNKDKIKQLRSMIKTYDLNSLEKSVINMTINTTRKEHSKRLRTTRKQDSIIIKDIQTQIKNMNKQRKQIYNNVRKTIKKRIHTETQKSKEDAREIKRLRKELRKQADYKEDIQDDYVNSLVDKYKINIKDNLEQLDQEMLKVEREKIKIKQQKVEERDAKRLIAEQKRYEKHLEKENKRIEKEREKERKKELKNKTRKNIQPKKRVVLRKTIKIKL